MNIELKIIPKRNLDQLRGVPCLLVTDMDTWAFAIWDGTSWFQLARSDVAPEQVLQIDPVYYANLDPFLGPKKENPCLDLPEPRVFNQKAMEESLLTEYTQGIVDCANLINKKVEYQK